MVDRTVNYKEIFEKYQNEFADAMEQGILSVGTIAHAMRATDDLLHTIYAGKFEKYTHYIDDMLKVIS